MAYLNEDGLETLVGKIKGQVIELTSAEYRQLPATKNSDNKLYFVNDEAYAYQIDDEPTSGSTGLVKSGGVYNWTSKIGSGTLTTTAQTLIPAVNEINAKIGSTDISSIGDGTVTGAVDELNDCLTKELVAFFTTYPNGHLYNVNYFVISVPFMNVKNTPVTVASAYVYDAKGGFNEITSSVSVSAFGKTVTNVNITFNSTYVGRLLRIGLQ